MHPVKLPPPERFTWLDAIQIAYGLIMIPMGAVIFYDTATRGAIALGMLVGGSFIGFGMHRTVLAAGRLRWYYAHPRPPRSAWHQAPAVRHLAAPVRWQADGLDGNPDRRAIRGNGHTPASR